MNISREEAIRKHREMWNWIAEQYENGVTVPVDCLKAKFVKEHYPNDDPDSKCYCCEYAGKTLNPVYGSPKYNCEKCPLEWPSNEKFFTCVYKTRGLEMDGLYGKITCYTDPTMGTYKKAVTIAREIANLPERKIEEE